MRSAFRQIPRSLCYRTPIVGRLSLPAFRFFRSGCIGPRRQFSIGRGQWSNTRHRETRSAFSLDDSTIYALSTAPGRAAIAVIRISGPSCVEIYHSLCPTKPLPKPRYAAVRTLYDPITAPTQDSILDSNALVLFFPAPNSSTGEDVLELHIHGGPAITASVLRALSRCAPTASTASTRPIRHAEPGEFTRRAFLNDRLDLTQVEALSDVLCAQTEQQRRLSVRGTSGRLARTYEDWRARLLRARAELEALIDFQEDQHFDEEPAALAASVAGQVAGLKRRIERHVENAMRGELLRNGIGLSLLGAPNAGKSSLLNRVVGREAAIVSQEAGTTRDVVEVGLDVGGYFCRLGDMAGVRSSSGNSLAMTGDTTQVRAQLTESSSVGKIEEEGIRRAKQRARESDLVIVVISAELDRNGEPHLPFPSDVLSTANECESEIVVVINKIDLIPPRNRQSLIATWAAALGPHFTNLESDRVFPISCKLASADAECQPEAIDPDPGNIQAFLHGLEAVFKHMTEPVPHGPDQHPPSAADDPSLLHDSLGASERHKVLLEECRGHLDAFLGQVHSPALSAPTGFARLGGEEINGRREEDIDIVIAAESLRAAADCLARITGRGEAGDVEEVLGVVFEKFCVGK